MKTNARQRFAGVVGVGLVVVGGWLLIERVAGPLLWPVRAMAEALASVGWPLVVIAAGIAVLVRVRSRATAPAAIPAPAVPVYDEPNMADASAGAPAPGIPAGPPASADAVPGPDTRLYRARGDRMFGGVIAGAAPRLGLTATTARLLFVVLTAITGVWPGVALYLIGLFAIPEEPVTSVAPAPPVPGVQAQVAPPAV